MISNEKLIALVKGWEQHAEQQQAGQKKMYDYYLGMEIGMGCLLKDILNILYPVADLEMFFFRVENQ